MMLPRLDDRTLVLRLGTVSDAQAITRYYVENRDALRPFDPRRPENFFTAPFWEVRAAMNVSQFSQRQSACLFVFEPDDATVIGAVNITHIQGYPAHSALLGYSLAQAHWGQGRMKRALRLALDWAFDYFHVHRIAANHLPDNERSARLLASLGFEREGYARDYLLIDGLWRDHVLTALTREDWRARDLHAGLVVNGTGRVS